MREKNKIKQEEIESEKERENKKRDLCHEKKPKKKRKEGAQG